ncbi:MAG: methyltransferase [Pseudomonadota bacterium]
MNRASLRRGLGGWLFRHRGWLPAPLLVAIALAARPDFGALCVGLVGAFLAEGLRCWAAHAIGPASRTRGVEPGELTVSGPYRFTRNPLYLANIAIYSGFAVASGRGWAWSLPLLALPYYALIVAWEEQALERTHGEVYLAFKASTPRWFPRRSAAPAGAPHATWPQAVRAERGSLIVLALMTAALIGQWACSAL